MGIRRPDFREVRPTGEEKAAWLLKYPRRKALPYRAEHLPCGTRIWYSGVGVAAHVRACPAYKAEGKEEQCSS